MRAQQLAPGGVAVGGTAAALYAKHRVSFDTDHLIGDLRENFQQTRDALEAADDWKTARVQPPVLILGSVNGVEVRFRQMRRSTPIATSSVETKSGALVVPTLDEILGMKAYLAYAHNATRDYLDFAALASCTDEASVLRTLLQSDQRYGELQRDSVALEIAKALAEPQPYDLDDTDLRTYKNIRPPYDDWQQVATVCTQFGLLLADSLFHENESEQSP